VEDIFDELLSNTQKRDYDEYLKDEFSAEREQVQRGIALEKQIVADFENFIHSRGKELGLELVTLSEDDIAKARTVLYNGQVVAVDGRKEKPLDVVSGIFCEVGVATVSYKTMHEPSVKCMSITSHIEDSTTKEDYYENSRKERVNETDVTNAMIYWELEACLDAAKTATWVLKDGPAMHPGLVWKDSATCFSHLEKVIAAKNIVGIVKDFRAAESLWRYGRCLKPGQYLVVYRGVGQWVKDIGKEGKLSADFKQGPGAKIVKGVFKAGRSFWIFEAHQDTVHQAMPVVMADALNNKRGMPQLIDLADKILGNRFPSGLYGKKINREFLQHGMDYYLDIVDERMLRG